MKFFFRLFVPTFLSLILPTSLAWPESQLAKLGVCELNQSSRADLDAILQEAPVSYMFAHDLERGVMSIHMNGEVRDFKVTSMEAVGAPSDLWGEYRSNSEVYMIRVNQHSGGFLIISYGKVVQDGLIASGTCDTVEE